MLHTSATYELWPLNGHMRHLSVAELSAALADANPEGSLSEGIPIFIEAQSVRHLLDSMKIVGREVDEVVSEVEEALRDWGVWKGDRAAIYRRLADDPGAEAGGTDQ